MDDIIDDPIAWQQKINCSKAPINLNGAAKFWNTAIARGLPVEGVNGSPEFTEIVFDIGDGVGVQLKSEFNDPYIQYRFVRIESDFDNDVVANQTLPGKHSDDHPSPTA